MKISIRKSNLLQGINIVSKAVSNKTTHPILSCILVEAAGGVIKLTANDMEIGIESYVDGTGRSDLAPAGSSLSGHSGNLRPAGDLPVTGR